MENYNVSETKEEHSSSSATDRRLIGLLPMFILVIIIVLRISWTLYKSFGHKTRNPQQRRVYVGSRPRQSLGTNEPTIYVSPSNLPPPPKYECMAPPSYEEVVGVHYPNYPVQQPIAQPIANALAQTQSGSANDTRTEDSVTRPNDTVVVTVNERTNVTTS